MKLAIVPCCFALLALISGCSSSTTVDVVDLNKVLDVFSSTLAELDGENPADMKAEAGDDAEVADEADVNGNTKTQTVEARGMAGQAVATESVASIKAVDAEDKDKTESFIKLFKTKLNAAKLVSTPIGVKIEESGVINGFADKDSNNVMAAGEKSIFKIEIDEERNRVVASDGGGHYRDHSYHGRSHGLFTGFLLGRMLSRNRGYYSGTRSSLKPNYGKTNMSPKTYHASAVSKARATARAKASTSSSRSRSGSKGMSFGK